MGQQQAGTIGLPGLLGLWILGRKYMTGVRGVVVMKFLAVSGRSPEAVKLNFNFIASGDLPEVEIQQFLNLLNSWTIFALMASITNT